MNGVEWRIAVIKNDSNHWEVEINIYFIKSATSILISCESTGKLIQVGLAALPCLLLSGIKSHGSDDLIRVW